MTTMTIPPRRRRTRPDGRNFLLLPLIAIGAILFLPIFTLVYQSFVVDTGGSVEYSLENFIIGFERVDFFRYAWNSFQLGIVYTIPVVISSFCAGYAFARLKAPGSKVLFSIVVATMLVPVFVYLIPLFVVYSRLGITNTVIPWLLWGIAGNAFYIFLFRQFFDAFPAELEEAAMLDGLNRFAIMTRIVLPNSSTIVATVAILAFTNVWGEVLMQGVLLFKDSAATLSVRLSQGIFNEQGNAILVEPTLALILLYVLPPVVVFVFFQRFILQGVATSGLK
jgi:ABC-type glycerol-3-phosphate transport system permease component